MLITRLKETEIVDKNKQYHIDFLKMLKKVYAYDEEVAGYLLNLYEKGEIRRPTGSIDRSLTWSQHPIRTHSQWSDLDNYIRRSNG